MSATGKVTRTGLRFPDTPRLSAVATPRAVTRLSVNDFFTTRLSAFVDVSKDIEIQKKTITIEHKKAFYVAIYHITHV